ncbi:MAG TPA: hypothetical protein VGE97_00540 [Nitrososphaera sp.]|jgi:hypothetical protein
MNPVAECKDNTQGRQDLQLSKDPSGKIILKAPPMTPREFCSSVVFACAAAAFFHDSESLGNVCEDVKAFCELAYPEEQRAPLKK